MDDLKFNQLVCQIYQSIEDIDRLVPVLRDIEQDIGAVNTYFMSVNNDHHVVSSFSSHPVYLQADQEYNAYFHSIDPNLTPLLNRSTPEWIADYQYLGEGFIKRSEFYNDFLARHHFKHLIASPFMSTNGGKETLTFLAADNKEQFTPHDLQLLQRFSPHFAMATKLRSQLKNLNQQNQNHTTLMSRLPYGALWVNAKGKMISANDVSQKMLADKDGLYVRDGRLLAVEPDDNARLALAIDLATTPINRRGQWLAIQRRKQITKLLLSIIPSADAHDEFSALIIIYDASRTVIPSTQLLRNLFQFTPKEAHLAVALLQNETLEEYAQHQQVSYNTVKTHLANLLQKTGTKRQSELIRTLLISQPHVQE